MIITEIHLEDDDLGNETGLAIRLSNGTGNAVSFGGGSNRTTFRAKCALQSMIKWIEDQEAKGEENQR